MSAHQFIVMRNEGYLTHIRGTGIEIGAFEHPAQLDPSCTVSFVDKFQPEDAKAVFPDLNCDHLVHIDHILDLDTEGLGAFTDASQDFVIINHVMEHVANPIRVLEEVFRVLKPGGHASIAVPDKWYTFDKNRPITPWEHLEEEYRAGVTTISDAHYIDFLAHVHPEMLTRGVDWLEKRIERCHMRTEHAHVWDCVAFKRFLSSAFRLLGIEAECVYEVVSDNNQFEYFGIYRKD